MKIKKKNTKIKIKNSANDEAFRKLFKDSPREESEILRKEIKERLINITKQTFILLNLRFKFTSAIAKELVPDMVSIIVPYNVHRHQING